MIDRHRNSLLQQHATQDIRLKGLFVQKPSSANQVRQAIAQAHPLTTQVGQVRLFASALNPYLNYINTVYECLYLNTIPLSIFLATTVNPLSEQQLTPLQRASAWKICAQHLDRLSKFGPGPAASDNMRLRLAEAAEREPGRADQT